METFHFANRTHSEISSVEFYNENYNETSKCPGIIKGLSFPLPIIVMFFECFQYITV